ARARTAAGARRRGAGRAQRNPARWPRPAAARRAAVLRGGRSVRAGTQSPLRGPRDGARRLRAVAGVDAGPPPRRRGGRRRALVGRARRGTGAASPLRRRLRGVPAPRAAVAAGHAARAILTLTDRAA